MNNKKITNQIVFEFDVLNQNGEIYTKESIQNAVEEFKNNHILKDRALGELCTHSEAIKNSCINLKYISHKITDVYVTNFGLLCDITILDTPMGNIVNDMLGIWEFENIFKISPRLIGTIQKGVIHVDEIISFDIDMVPNNTNFKFERRQRILRKILDDKYEK